MAKIVFDDDIPFSDPNRRNLVDEVSVKKPVTYGPENGYRVCAVDCGIKSNVIRYALLSAHWCDILTIRTTYECVCSALVKKGCRVTVVPWDYDFLPELESGVYDGLFISNGPGDPEILEVSSTLLCVVRSRRAHWWFYCAEIDCSRSQGV